MSVVSASSFNVSGLMVRPTSAIALMKSLTPAELAASASENFCTFATEARTAGPSSSNSLSPLSRMSDARAAIFWAVCTRSWKSERSARSTAGSAADVFKDGAFELPPPSATEALPVRPWYSSFTLVSVRTGTRPSTRMIA